MPDAKTKRRWYQFSLRRLLILTTLIACGLGWLAYERQQARRQEQAIAVLQRRGAYVIIEKLEDGVPGWVRTMTGDDNYVALVDLYSTPATDDDLTHLRALRRLYGLKLMQTQIGDEGLKHLAGARKITYLDLQDTQITDVGLKWIAPLKTLKILDLSRTSVGDVGLQQLAGLTGLEFLGLEGTGVTDAGLEHLAGLTHLEKITLGGTRVTDAGIENLQRALPNIEIVR